MKATEVTLDLEKFIAPDLAHILGNETLDIYNLNLEKNYASHESGTPIYGVRNLYNSKIVASRPDPHINWPYPNIEKMYGR